MPTTCKEQKKFQDLLVQHSDAFYLTEIIIWQMDTKLIPERNRFFANDSMEVKLGIHRDKEGYFSFSDFIDSVYPDDEGKSQLAEMNSLKEQCGNGEINNFSVIIKHLNKDTNETVYFKHKVKIQKRLPSGKAEVLIGYSFDVSTQHKMKTAITELEEVNKQLRLANESAVRIAKMMTWRMDFDLIPDGSRFYANQVMDDMLGIKRDKEGLFNLNEFAGTYYPDEEGKETMEVIFKSFDLCLKNKEDGYTHIVKHLNHKTGKECYFKHTCQVSSRNPDGTVKTINGYNIDVTDRLLAERENEFLVNYDVMTKLKNRNSFERYIEEFTYSKPLTIVIIDIDGLKLINDTFGHLFGDETIKQLSSILLQEFETDSEIFRVGGDEFTIISKITNENVIAKRLDRVHKAFAEFKNPVSESSSISYGYQFLKDKNTNILSIFTEAENIMYHSKLNNRSSRKRKSLDLIMDTLNQKTAETLEHCTNVEKYSVELMKELGYTRTKDIEEMRLLCRVHDIGKITISEEILNKPDLLNKEERKRIETHCEAGYKIIKNVIESEDIALGVLHHHERIDGKGYPLGLKGEQIPAFARIICITDSYDAMTSERLFRKAISKQDAIKELTNCAGTHFDEEYVHVFINLISKE